MRWFACPKTTAHPSRPTSRCSRESNSRPSTRKSNALTTRLPSQLCVCVGGCSTWLTVMMAVSRYIAVCHPLHARSFISHRGTRVTIFAVWIGSLGVNVPRFWRYQPRTLPCRLLGLDVVVPAGCQCFYYWKYPHPGGLLLNSGFATAYRAVWATVAIFVPLVALIICNWCLVKALRRSSAMQQRFCRVSSTASARVTLAESTATGSLRNRNDSVFAGPGSLRTPTTAGHRITPTLVALVVLFIVLVGPSEILTFAKDVMTRQVVSTLLILIYSVIFLVFGALILLVGRQEERLACKN